MGRRAGVARARRQKKGEKEGDAVEAAAIEKGQWIFTWGGWDLDKMSYLFIFIIFKE